MTSDIQFIGIILNVLAMIAVIVMMVWICSTTKKSPLIVIYIALAVLCGWWCFCQLLIIAAPHARGIALVISMQYLAGCFLPVLGVWFAIRFTNIKIKHEQWVQSVCFLIPLLVFVGFLTNPLHHRLLIHNVSGLENTGDWFWVHLLISYSFALLSLLIMVLSYFRKPSNQNILVIGAIAIPILSSALFTFRMIPFPFSPISISSAFSMLLLFLAISHKPHFMRFADDTNIYESIYESIPDAVLFVNMEGFVLNANQAYQQLLAKIPLLMGQDKLENICLSFKKAGFLLEPQDLCERMQKKPQMQVRGEIFDPLHSTFYTIGIQPLRSSPNTPSGFLITISDVSSYKRIMAEMNQQNVKLLHLKDQAEASSLAKSTFLASISRKLQTPMNSLLGMSEFMLRQELEEDVHKFALKIRTSTFSLLRIIDDVLDLAKVETGKLELIDNNYHFNLLIDDVAGIISARIGDKPIAFSVEYSPNIPSQLIGDEVRIRQVLLHILTNAVNFTEQGFVRLTVEGQAEPEGYRLFFAVEDSGCGMSQEAITYIFSVFSQADARQNRNSEGAGLGLAISQRLIYLMQGNITAHSTYKTGSIFRFDILQQVNDGEPAVSLSQTDAIRVAFLTSNPHDLRSWGNILRSLEINYTSHANEAELVEELRSATYSHALVDGEDLHAAEQLDSFLIKPVIVLNRGEDLPPDYALYPVVRKPILPYTMAQILSGSISNSPIRFQINEMGLNDVAPGVRVLLVDGNQVNLQVALELLNTYEFRIDTADSAGQALQLIQNNQYDLIFMDHMIPEMDGMEITSALRQMTGEYYQTVPVIALTADAVVEMQDNFLAAGMNDFITKPIETKQLDRIVRSFIPTDKFMKKRMSYFSPFYSVMNDSLTYGVQKTSDDELTDQIDVIKGIANAAEKEDLYLKIVGIFIEQYASKKKELTDLYKKKDFQMLEIEFHSLKSSAITLGAEILPDIAIEFERAAKHHDYDFLAAKFDIFLSQYQSTCQALAAAAARLEEASKR